MSSSDSIRPRGTVQVECDGCKAKDDPGWFFWIACDDPSLPDGPFMCASCRGNDLTKEETE